MSDTTPDQARAASATLRARGLDVLGGIPDSELDQWPVAVPEAVRAVLREIGGVRDGDARYEFGPDHLADGQWWIGDVADDGTSLTVGVGGDAWGPVLRSQGWGEETEFVVEAPSFTSWLLGLGAEPSAPKASVTAVPSIEAAEGPDEELAALVAGGDSLTDVVDLRELPGYPCRVVWEAYHSLDDDTADTGGSDTEWELVGGGRALLLRSLPSGDYLDRPVRRHRVPADAARLAVAELRALAGAHPHHVTLDPGCDDAVMDTWPVPVPEDVRTVLREIGGVRMAGLPPLRLLPGAPEHAVDPEVHRMMGGDGTYWPVALVEHPHSRALAQIRIDPDTGEWGYAVSVPTDHQLSSDPELVLLAESLPHLLLTVARVGREAAATDDFARHARGVTSWFMPNTGEPWTRPVPVEEWSGTSDPLRAALTGLPPGTHVADLRDSPIPTDLCFHRSRVWPYGKDTLDRLHFTAAGRLVAAIPKSPA
ncbi:hypothetical protein E2C00_23875 [Streptomyces sp. WAC05374]|uniref:hypothetical protein n=1 Tax=Streptomyces sp. WAC05374 TaxID=2487420 RepID=UPI000F863600|nr:hypothetical protein [Streptomyces sp. WAC05374]RST14038.1 hypothetical protein EF905_18545 [Streptomyces sp. WAC05374]TDF42639.1 hypothetical protein E2B92_22240 [Streptomyces sp. WAC05374]TDF51199.1 hypothetical protein E2C02_24735 [Streptomyces sp. WAC05374]TDF52512.1 hypothetical protein E2C00_23875 [Streptomyces sp. WAC05374]